MKPLIIIHSKDAEFYLLFEHIFDTAGFAIKLSSDTETAVRFAGEKQAFAIVIDSQPHDRSGVDLCARLKQDARFQGVRIVALIASGAQESQVELIQAGVDETFLRPFAPRKLLNFLNAGDSKTVLGRTSPAHEILDFSRDEFRVRTENREIYLAPIEFKLLQHLAASPGRVIRREELIKAAWPEGEEPDIRSVDVHIVRLRKALKVVEGQSWVRTVRSAGYTFAPDI